MQTKKIITSFKTICLVGILAILYNCNNSNNTGTNRQSGMPHENTKEKYAKYFSVSDNGGPIKTITIKNTWSGKPKDDVYTLVPRDCTQLLAKDLFTLPYPLKSIVCMSSSHVAYLAALEEERCIKGISGTRFIYNKNVQELIKSGTIEDIGAETLPDYERIMYMKPDAVIAYGISGTDNSYIDKLQKLGIKVLTIGDYLENSPLGKMEYLKLFGELTGKREIADSLFEYKENEYISLKNKISAAIGDSRHTRVMINAPYNGIWYIPGSENYISQLVQDAGGIILGSKENEVQSDQLGFEQAYIYALQADIWLHPNTINRLEELAAANSLFKNIPSFKNGRIYNNTLRNTPEGGSDFWESGAIEPHIILQDLACILHPDMFDENYKFKYYLKLK